MDMFSMGFSLVFELL